MPLTATAPTTPLVDDQVAALWTGRDPSTIRHWGLEGRITRHPLRHPNGRRGIGYNLHELPPADDHGTPGPIPPLPAQPAAA